MIHGIIDIGSNTIRMAVYKVDSDKLELLIKKKHIIGLAAHIQENRMQQEGIDKACEVLLGYKNFLQNFCISNVVAFTTAALRNVENSEAAVREIIARTGIHITVITGEEEAAFDFSGATQSIETESGILIDIGGASTELVLYRNKQISRVASLPMGSLFMHTKFVEGLLPSRSETEAMRAEVLGQLSRHGDLFQPGGGWEICGIGGSFKGAWQLHGELFPQQKKSRKMTVGNLKKMIAYFACDAAIVSNEVLDILVRAVPERIKTVVPGMIIAETLADYFASENIVYSDSGMREGYLYERIMKKERRTISAATK